jgi:CRP-like cAMP-binding protein
MPHDAAAENLLRNELIRVQGVTKLPSARRRLPLFEQGGPAESLYFLESGLVKIFRRSGVAKPMILRVVTPGELFGEDAAWPHGAHGNSAEVLAEASIHVIPRATFTSFCEGKPQGWQVLSAMLLERTRQLEGRIELLSVRDVERRVVHTLGGLAIKMKRSHAREVTIPISQGELASLIGATRETTSTILNTLQRRGLVRLERRLLTVTSVDNIRAASG